MGLPFHRGYVQEFRCSLKLIMREFIYYSKKAPTSGKLIGEDLTKSGRLDIAIHSLIAAFFLSEDMRRDVKFHLVLAGPPDPTKHLEFKPVFEGQTGADKVYLNKKNVSKIIKKMLYKYKEGEKKEVFPGYWIEKKDFIKLVRELSESGRNLYLLDPKGEDIRSAEIKDNPIFILGDHEGLSKKEIKALKKLCTSVTTGPKTYFASHTIVVVNNELDRRGV